ncbi:MAG: putative manganese-dependent inorganic diphosphatase [Treponemataceae bacterium]
MDMAKKVSVIGHRNPDTDSVVSAASLAYLRRALGFTNYTAARAGKINPQTEYIFNRFKVPIPEYVPDLIPKVGYFMGGRCDFVESSTSLWNAIAKMELNNSKVLPIVDKNNTYQALLHYNAFAQNVLKILNPEKEAVIPTSIRLIKETLNAQPLVLSKNENEIFKTTILIASSQFETFKKYLDIHLPGNVVVICDDRTDVQEYCIEKQIKALVVSCESVFDKSLRQKAEKNNVSILVSPYDTSSTSMLVVYATPVSVMADSNIQPVKPTDTLRKIRPILASSASRCLPVVNEKNQVIGIISESDLIQPATIEVALVDHNELTQAVEGVENYKIREIIDHHRIGNLSTRYPITFINKPVGATSTIITNLFREHKVPLTKEIASILLSGILADTLVLHSSTTTEVDTEAAEFLSNLTNLEIELLGSDIIAAASHITGRTATEVIHQDMKEYVENNATFTVSQIEVDNPNELIARKDEFLSELEIERRTAKAVFSAIMVTDTTHLTSVLLIAGDAFFMQVLSLPKQEDGVYLLKDIVSRKKQLVPLLIEQIEKLESNS